MFMGGTLCRGGTTCRGWIGNEDAKDGSPECLIFVAEILLDAPNKLPRLQLADALPHLPFAYVTSLCERRDATLHVSELKPRESL